MDKFLKQFRKMPGTLFLTQWNAGKFFLYVYSIEPVLYGRGRFAF